MKDSELVWSSEHGDMRKKAKSKQKDQEVDESCLVLELRRLKSGKGRVMIEISALPANKKWNQKLCKDIKKKLGSGGAFKGDYIEIHIQDIEKVSKILEQRSIKWKKVGG